MEQSPPSSPTSSVSAEQPAHVAKLLDALPGLVGAIDQAVLDKSGRRLPFVLLVFAGNGALHATNIQPAARAIAAVKDLAAHWDEAPPTEHPRPGDETH